MMYVLAKNGFEVSILGNLQEKTILSTENSLIICHLVVSNFHLSIHTRLKTCRCNIVYRLIFKYQSIIWLSSPIIKLHPSKLKSLESDFTCAYISYISIIGFLSRNLKFLFLACNFDDQFD